MDSTNLNTIKVTLKPHPIKDQTYVKEVEKKSYREIFESFNLPLTIDYAIIYDGENVVPKELYDTTPTVNHIYIRLVPEGDAVEAVGDFFVDVGQAIFEGIETVTSFIFEKTLGFFRWLFGGGNKRTKPLRSPSIRGSSNPTLKGQRLPILLGKHLVFPAHASSPYTVNVLQDDHKDRPRYPDRQRVRQLFCAGTKYMTVDESTVKLGDTHTSDIAQAIVEFRQAGEATTVYGNRHFMTPVNKEIEADHPDDDDVLVVTTPTNTETIRFNFIAQSGFGAPEDNKLNKITIGDVLFMRDVDSTGDFTKVGRQEEKGASYHTFRWEHTIGNPNSIVPSTKRQWTVKVVRSHSMKEDSNRRDRYSLESIVCTTADFSSNPVDRVPIRDDLRVELTIVETQFNATNLVQGTVENFNFVATLNTFVYSGTDEDDTGPTYWASRGDTQNPAACFLYLLRDPYVTAYPASDSQIDWPRLEAWYRFCNTNSFECNMYFNDDVTIKDIMEEVCRVGRASWTMIDGKFSIIIDQENQTITQYFTARNTSNFSGRKAFTDVTTCYRVKFTNPLADYEEAERLVYFDDYQGPPRSTDIVEDLEVPASIPPDQAVAMGRYFLASNRLRPEQFSFDVDTEYIFCTRGDRVQLNHDVPLLGLASCRVASVEETGGNTISLTADELLTYEFGETYGIKVRKFDGTTVDINIENQATQQDQTVTSYAMEFETAETGTGIYEGNELVMFGERGSETLDLIVMHIQPNANLGATLLCVEYNEDVYDVGTIPAYNPKISLPGESGGSLNLGNTPSPDDYNDTNNSDSLITSQLADMVNRALTAYIQDGDQQLEITGFRPVFTGANTFVYINYNDGNTIYTKNISDNQNVAGTQIVTVAADYLMFIGSDTILYSNTSDLSRLYIKVLAESGNGTRLTTASAKSPVSDDEGTVFYINLDDGNTIYETTVDGGNGTQLADIAVQGLLHNDAGKLLYVSSTDGKVYIKDDDDDSAGSILLAHPDGVHGLMHLDDDYYLYITNKDHTLFRNRYDSTDTTVLGEALFEIVSSAAGYNGNILFSTQRPNLQTPGVIYYSGINRARRDPQIVLKPQVETIQFRADTLNGGYYARNISDEFVNIVTPNDIISGDGIPDGTRVRYVGPDYVTMSNAATSTQTQGLLQIYGDRLFIDANKVIATGSIEARHLRASAIDSKELTDTNERISEYDLDNGAVKIRKKDGTLVYDFDAERTGSELRFSGNITASAVGSDGNAIPTGTQLDAKATVFRQATEPTEAVDGDIWIDESNHEIQLIKDTGTAAGPGDYPPENWTTVSYQSRNFTSDTSGWRILESGNAEFNDVTARGTLYAENGFIGGTLSSPHIYSAMTTLDPAVSWDAGDSMNFNLLDDIVLGNLSLQHIEATVNGEMCNAYRTTKSPQSDGSFHYIVRFYVIDDDGPHFIGQENSLTTTFAHTAEVRRIPEPNVNFGALKIAQGMDGIIENGASYSYVIQPRYATSAGQYEFSSGSVPTPIINNATLYTSINTVYQAITDVRSQVHSFRIYGYLGYSSTRCVVVGASYNTSNSFVLHTSAGEITVYSSGTQSCQYRLTT